MDQTYRRSLLGTLAVGAGAMAALPAQGAEDGHAKGHDVAAAAPADRMRTIPRKPGDPQAFSASLDNGPIKATSGGWARDITSRQLPIATGLAGAHLFIAPGGLREMHWHSSSEWAYILDGNCQVTVVDPGGELEVANYGPGDLWFFPAGFAHAIQTLGEQPCHAILAFNDGLYGEHGTFGLTDLVSRLDPGTLSRALHQPENTFAGLPSAETYIIQGPVLKLDGPEARRARPLTAERTYRHRLLAAAPYERFPGGTMRLASSRQFARCQDMSGYQLTMEPGAMQAPHWHPSANEWIYVARGKVRATLFGPDKRLAIAELAAGDCAYFPRSCGHLIENVGDSSCEIVGATDSGTYIEAKLSDWFALAPRHVLAANLGVPASSLPPFGSHPQRLARG